MTHDFLMLPNDNEVQRRLAVARHKLTNPDFSACRDLLGADVPAAIRNLYSDHELVTSRGAQLGPLLVLWFDPMVPPFHVYNDESGRRFLSFAMGDDGQTFAVLVDSDNGLSPIFACWDDGKPDPLDLTLDSLLLARGG